MPMSMGDVPLNLRGSLVENGQNNNDDENATPEPEGKLSYHSCLPTKVSSVLTDIQLGRIRMGCKVVRRLV